MVPDGRVVPTLVRGDPKYERVALKYLTRYLTEGEPSLADVTQMAALLAERSLIMRGL